jgi:hypothetical protein
MLRIVDFSRQLSAAFRVRFRAGCAPGSHQTATRTPVMTAKAAQTDRISTLTVVDMIGFSKGFGRTHVF